MANISSKQQFKVIHVELNDPYEGEYHFYFGSKTAIYDLFTPERIGISKESLWNQDLKSKEYQNRLCTIRMAPLRRKQTLRGGKKGEKE